MLRITNHVKDWLENGRPVMSVSTLEKIAQRIEPIVNNYSGSNVRQIAFILYRYDTKKELSGSYGDTLYLMVDVKNNSIPTVFVRFYGQGKPKQADIVLDITGKRYA